MNASMPDPHKQQDKTKSERNETRAKQKNQSDVRADISISDKDITRNPRTNGEKEYAIQKSIRNAAWAAFIAAVFYAGITYFQWNDANKNFRRDERAWLELRDEPPSIAEGRPISTLIRVTNIGKTPAKQIFFQGTIGIIPREKAPALNLLPGAVTRAEMGIMWPTGNAIVDQFTQDPIALVMQLTSGNPLSHDQFVSLSKGDTYVVVHGEILFLDIFSNSTHWLRFCSWKNFGPLGTQSEAQTCVADNTTDDN